MYIYSSKKRTVGLGYVQFPVVVNRFRPGGLLSPRLIQDKGITIHLTSPTKAKESTLKDRAKTSLSTNRLQCGSVGLPVLVGLPLPGSAWLL